jgi:hypothetical protein
MIPKNKFPKAFYEYQKIYSKEKKEHPKLPDWAIRQVARDHLKKKLKI